MTWKEKREDGDSLRGGTLETIEQFVVGKVLQSGRIPGARELKNWAHAFVVCTQRAWHTGMAA